MAPICRQSRTNNFDFVDRLEKPLAPFDRELRFPDPMSGIADERIWEMNLHLVFNKSAIHKRLDRVIGLDAPRARGLLEFFNSMASLMDFAYAGSERCSENRNGRSDRSIVAATM